MRNLIYMLREQTRIVRIKREAPAMPPRFPKRLNVDDFATMNRRSVLRGLGAAALVTATGGLFSRCVWANPNGVSRPVDA